MLRRSVSHFDWSECRDQYLPDMGAAAERPAEVTAGEETKTANWEGPGWAPVQWIEHQWGRYLWRDNGQSGLLLG